MAEPVTFREMHHRDRPFVIPNPWDVGSARILASMGFEALATTSAGMGHTLGCAIGGGAKPELQQLNAALAALEPGPVELPGMAQSLTAPAAADASETE